MNPIRSWWEGWKLSRLLKRQLKWMERSIELLEEEDALAAERLRSRIRARLLSPIERDADPMMRVIDVTTMVLDALEAENERLAAQRTEALRAATH